MNLIVTLNVSPDFNFVKDDLKIKIFYYYIRKFVAYDILVFHIIDLHKVSTAEWQLFQYIITNHNAIAASYTSFLCPNLQICCSTQAESHFLSPHEAVWYSDLPQQCSH